jgi:hypothetical protein
MRHKIGHIRSIFLRLGLILGVALLAFAHPPLRAHVVDLSAYAMPDGTLPDLCLEDADADHPAQGVHCPACHLAAEPPAPRPNIAAVWTELPQILQPQTAAQFIPSLRTNAPPEARAPPALTV